ncbi:alpha/beta fold hydrolase [Hyalangium rubrum]|uniref:Alpha/beta fold hydrolase n=1 Tax=Hyalangium rubrum TaxID=3103134 RepID=A0ABU5H1N5_9BACT|nr:alpha/beta fold hydrolase [Hyalangium sp. s54d21]MDY7227231.1 alpha/beta fold hydrolase [Hyalangium sp. s54d21]
MNIHIEQLTIPATDGYKLAATLFSPEEETTGPVVLINPATGVKRTLYAQFARFLAGRGMYVLTYDYRGIGGSRPKPLRSLKSNMEAWGTGDLAGAVDWLVERYPRRPLLAVGHSSGGQLLGLTDRAQYVSAMLGVGAQSGYWRHWSGPRRYALACLWYAVMPAASRLLGYFPAKRLGLGEDLPGEVAREWARWCRNPAYICDERGVPLRPHFEEFSGPLRAYSFSDDTFAPRAAVEALLGFYRRARKEHLHLHPADLEVDSIGHFKWLRESFRASLWEDMASWLEQQARAVRPSAPGMRLGASQPPTQPPPLS